MDYELAKQLKEAGFPQDIRDSNSDLPAWWTKDGDIIEPTLSELIEACGDRFDNLEKRGNSYFAFGSTQTLLRQKVDPFLGAGATPEEAVANLWLALNK